MKNYYLILGVPRTESYRGIRGAYRDLARELHPQRIGPRGEEPFRDLVEAYETLSDPARRRRYNLDLDHELARPAGGGVSDEAAPIELSAASDRSAPGSPGASDLLMPAPIRVLSDPDTVRPSLEAMHMRFRRNFPGARVPKAERVEGLNIEVVLTPEEALQGGIVPLTLPVWERCGDCQGSGRDWGYPCFACGGEGVVERERTVRVRIPPMVRPRTVLEYPQELGLERQRHRPDLVEVDDAVARVL